MRVIDTYRLLETQSRSMRTAGLCVVAVVLWTSRAGADDRQLSFDQAVQVALAHNGDLYVARQDTAITADDIAQARSVFDPRLIASARIGRDDELGSPIRLAWTDLLVTDSVELTGLASTGATYSLGFTFTDDHYSAPLLGFYDPSYLTTLSVSLTQPLLRNGWRTATHQPIVVASLRHDLSEQQLRVQLEVLVGEIETAYWGLELARNEVEARDASLKLATEQVAESQRLVRLGTISDLDVIEAQAGVDRAQQQLLTAQQHESQAEGELRRVIVGDPGWKPDDVLVPTDSADVEQVSDSIQEHLEAARRNRPDLIADRAQIDAEQAQLVVTADQLKPQLDLVVGGSLYGFSGTIDPNGALAAVPNYMADARAIGGAGKAFENLAVGGNYVVSLGVRLELPISNSAAKARNAHQRDVVVRAKLQQQALLAQVENEVRTSLALLKDNEKLEQAADKAVTTTQKLLAGMRKRFAAGAVTSYDVLRVADQLTQAQIDAARARVNYRLSLARLATADGTLLERHHITLGSLGHPN